MNNPWLQTAFSSSKELSTGRQINNCSSTFILGSFFRKEKSCNTVTTKQIKRLQVNFAFLACHGTIPFYGYKYNLLVKGIFAACKVLI